MGRILVTMMASSLLFKGFMQILNNGYFDQGS